MKITKQYLKQLIMEEIENMEESDEIGMRSAMPGTSIKNTPNGRPTSDSLPGPKGKYSDSMMTLYKIAEVLKRLGETQLELDLQQAINFFVKQSVSQNPDVRHRIVTLPDND